MWCYCRSVRRYTFNFTKCLQKNTLPTCFILYNLMYKMLLLCGCTTVRASDNHVSQSWRFILMLGLMGHKDETSWEPLTLKMIRSSLNWSHLKSRILGFNCPPQISHGQCLTIVYLSRRGSLPHKGQQLANHINSCTRAPAVQMQRSIQRKQIDNSMIHLLKVL